MFENALDIDHPFSKFFTLVLSVNLTGLILAIFDIWSYPRNYTGAFVLGNLLLAILMRNELFGRFLYLLVNTLFAKVCPFLSCRLCFADWMKVDPSEVQAWLYIGAAAPRRNT